MHFRKMQMEVVISRCGATKNLRMEKKSRFYLCALLRYSNFFQYPRIRSSRYQLVVLFFEIQKF